jgi:hypothetical protein
MQLLRLTPFLLVFTLVSCTPSDQDSEVVDLDSEVVDLDATVSSSDSMQNSAPDGPKKIGPIQIVNQKQFSKKSDPFDISKAKVNGDVLQLDVSCGGGCEEHLFAAFSTGKFDEGSPANIEIFISHDANNDQCEAIISEKLEIDLSPLKDAYLAAHPDAESGVMNITIKTQKVKVTYQF